MWYNIVCTPLPRASKTPLLMCLQRTSCADGSEWARIGDIVLGRVCEGRIKDFSQMRSGFMATLLKDRMYNVCVVTQTFGGLTVSLDLTLKQWSSMVLRLLWKTL